MVTGPFQFTDEPLASAPALNDKHVSSSTRDNLTPITSKPNGPAHL